MPKVMIYPVNLQDQPGQPLQLRPEDEATINAAEQVTVRTEISGPHALVVILVEE